jgi:hypothetical protein
VESENELREDLNELGIEAYQRKTADVPDTVLLDLIQRVEQQD